MDVGAALVTKNSEKFSSKILCALRITSNLPSSTSPRSEPLEADNTLLGAPYRLRFDLGALTKSEVDAYSAALLSAAAGRRD